MPAYFDAEALGARCDQCGGPRGRRLRFCTMACKVAHVRAHSQTPYVGHDSGPRLRRLHQRIVEEATGPLPAGWEIHHVNEDKRDNRPENLVACETTRTHDLVERIPALLARATWCGAAGASVRMLRLVEPAGERICVRCLKCLPVTAFYKGRRGMLRGHCKECHARVF